MKSLLFSFGAILIVGALALTTPKTYALNSGNDAELTASRIDTVSKNTENVVADEFKEVTVDQLNEKVKESLKKLSESYNIEKLFYNAAKKITKVQVVAKADQTKSEIKINDEGQKVE